MPQIITSSTQTDIKMFFFVSCFFDVVFYVKKAIRSITGMYYEVSVDLLTSKIGFLLAVTSISEKDYSEHYIASFEAAGFKNFLKCTAIKKRVNFLKSNFLNN